ncbi:hypothetical protein F4560_002661 [Saccharothrix ecbatanensis]|uniref:Helix-turn-helix protein n=1 Tax=Saccharothrix ecbatanensis TaxID=1105145 RepID=A0A7W9HIF9_9PSEU|nr:hypothetical protein [Saccharothrix ecbatanensis]MBB5802893.1 hypothetical protein [Saccharothrix ecbatanensis]
MNRGRAVGFTVHLRAGLFSRAVTLAGFESDYALARAMEVNRSTVARVRQGELQPGPAFIGGALTALAPMQFADLFAVERIGDREAGVSVDAGVSVGEANVVYSAEAGGVQQAGGTVVDSGPDR